MRACAVCGSENKTAIKEIKMTFKDGTPLPSSYDIVVCGRCGFCYADSLATEEDYEKYYVECNDYAYCPRATDIKDMIFEEMIKVLSKYISKTAEIINIGIGRGKLEELLSGGGV